MKAVLCVFVLLFTAICAEPGILQPRFAEVGTGNGPAQAPAANAETIAKDCFVIGDLGSSGTRLVLTYKGEQVFNSDDGRCAQGKKLSPETVAKFNAVCNVAYNKDTTAMSVLFNEVGKETAEKQKCVLKLVLQDLGNDCANNLPGKNDELPQDLKDKDAAFFKEVVARSKWAMYATAGLRLVQGVNDKKSGDFFAALKTGANEARKAMNAGAADDSDGKIVSGVFEGIFGFLAATKGEADAMKETVYIEYGGASQQIVMPANQEPLPKWGSFAQLAEKVSTRGYIKKKKIGKAFSHSYLTSGTNRFSMHLLYETLAAAKKAGKNIKNGVDFPCGWKGVSFDNLSGQAKFSHNIFGKDKLGPDKQKMDAELHFDKGLQDQLNNKNWGQTHESQFLRENKWKVTGNPNFVECEKLVHKIFRNNKDETSSGNNKQLDTGKQGIQGSKLSTQVDAVNKAFSHVKADIKKVIINQAALRFAIGDKKKPVEVSALLKKFCDASKEAKVEKKKVHYFDGSIKTRDKDLYTGISPFDFTKCGTGALIYFTLFDAQGDLRLDPKKDTPEIFSPAVEWVPGAALLLNQIKQDGGNAAEYIKAYHSDVQTNEFKTDG